MCAISNVLVSKLALTYSTSADQTFSGQSRFLVCLCNSMYHLQPN